MQPMGRAFVRCISFSSKRLNSIPQATNSSVLSLSLGTGVVITAAVIYGRATAKKVSVDSVDGIDQDMLDRRRVQLQGVSFAPEYNGMQGVVLATAEQYEASETAQQGHKTVLLDSGQLLVLNAANLFPVSYALSPIEGKGMGVVAIRDIKYGERLIAEPPLLTFTRGSEITAAEALPKAKRTLLDSLHNSHTDPFGDRGILGILQTNALSIDSGIGLSGIFVTISRFNHSCVPNVQYNWNDRLHAETVHACRDICCGEELCFSYLSVESEPGLCSAKEMRLATLQQRYRFVCSCSSCALTGKRQATSDARRQLIFDLDEQIPDAVRQARNADAEVLVQRRLQLLSEEGLDEPAVKQRTTYYAYQACKFASWHERARTWLEASAQHGVAGAGSDTALHARYNRMLSRPLDAPHDPCYA